MVYMVGNGSFFGIAISFDPLNDFRSSMPATVVPHNNEFLVRVELPNFHEYFGCDDHVLSYDVRLQARKVVVLLFVF